MSLHILNLSESESASEVAQELGDAADAGELTILVGAGISYSPPASLPLAFDLISIASHVISSELCITYESLLTHDNSPMRLEPFLRLVQAVCSNEYVDKFLDVLRRGKPNLNHIALAKFLIRKNRSVVISLNFDYLIEEAISDLFGVRAEAVIPKSGLEEIIYPLDKNFVPDNESLTDLQISLLKPHGSLIRNGRTKGIIATIQNLGFNLPLVNRITEEIESRTLFVTGYSDDDIDIFPLLMSTRPKNVYWNTLSGNLPIKVESWLRELAKNCNIIHVIGACENIFNKFPERNDECIPKLADKELQEYHKYFTKWVRDINNKVKIIGIAAWIAQDRHRIDLAKELYDRALSQVECKQDKHLGRLLHYRYAELLRHQAEEKEKAFEEYIKILINSVQPPVEIPAVIVTFRSLAGAFRSLSHRASSIKCLLLSVISLIGIFLALLLSWLTPASQWEVSKFIMERDGPTWIYWELAMTLLGPVLKIKWPVRIKKALFMINLGVFEKAQRSKDLYEKSASLFGQARILAAIAHINRDTNYQRQALSKLEEATTMFKIFDDVTGLDNSNLLNKTILEMGPDPWIDF